MNREERIEKARRMAAEGAPSSGEVARRQASRTYQRLSNVGASQAQRHVTAAEQSADAGYLVRDESPDEWSRAVELARSVTITRAKRRDTITSGEIRWVIFDELRMLVDDAAFTDLLLAMSPVSDDALLGTIVVDPDDGRPSDDLLLAGMEMGFDEPTDVLQRQVYSRFG